MKKYLLPLIIILVGLSCQSKEPAISSIENNLLPTFYIEGEEPAPVTLEERMKYHGVPGLSVAVYRNGKLDWAKGYGLADIESNTPVTPQTLFQAASISKPVTAMAVLDMAEEGNIDLDADINEYLSSWELAENEFTAEEKVTFRRILNHTAGTTVWGFPGYSRESDIPDAVGVVSGLGNTDSISVYKVPGESWQYSGGGYTVMQIALSDVTGERFEDIMAERVLQPLEMKSSTFEQPLPEQYHQIAATGYRSDSTEVEGKWHVYPEQAAAGLWTTAVDIGKYAVSIQNALDGNNSILDEATVKEMLMAGDNDYGLGPGIRFDGSHFGHGGANAGFRNDFVASMEGGNVVAIMTNSDNGSRVAAELMQAIFRHYGWKGYQPDVRSKIDLPHERLELYTGTYSIPELGEITIVLNDGNLKTEKGEVIQQEVKLIPENDSTFFDASDGTSFHFNIQEGDVKGFEVQGFTASRMED